MAASLRQQAKVVEDGKEAAAQPAVAPPRKSAVKARHLSGKPGRMKKTARLPVGSSKTLKTRPASRTKRKGVSEEAA